MKTFAVLLGILSTIVLLGFGAAWFHDKFRNRS